MSSYYKLRIQDLEASRLKLISDVTELKAENEKLKTQLKRTKARVAKTRAMIIIPAATVTQ